MELLAPLGRFDEALAEVRRARELDAFSPAIADGHAWVLLYPRRFEESEEEYRRLFASGVINEGARPGLAFALMGQRKYRECLEQYTRIAAADPSPFNESMMAWILALAGDVTEARRRLIALMELSHSRYVPARYSSARSHRAWRDGLRL